jgi:hypothetical protein
MKQRKKRLPRHKFQPGDPVLFCHPAGHWDEVGTVVTGKAKWSFKGSDLAVLDVLTDFYNGPVIFALPLKRLKLNATALDLLVRDV